jgi:flagellar FliJ protein
MLAELDALAAVAADEAAAAQADYTEARRRAVGLEKLEARHDVAFAASELQAEQRALDEVASAAWHRKAGS